MAFLAWVADFLRSPATGNPVCDYIKLSSFPMHSASVRLKGAPNQSERATSHGCLRTNFCFSMWAREFKYLSSNLRYFSRLPLSVFRRLLRHRPARVDPREYSLRVRDGISDGGFQRWAGSALTCCDSTRCQNCSRNQQRSASKVVHFGSLPCSLCIRHILPATDKQ